MNYTDHDTGLALKAIALVQSFGVDSFDEYGPNHPGQITLPAAAGPMPEPLKIEQWTIAKAVALSRGWVVADGSHLEITSASTNAVRRFAQGTFDYAASESQWATKLLVGVAATAAFVESLKSIIGW